MDSYSFRRICVVVIGFLPILGALVYRRFRSSPQKVTVASSSHPSYAPSSSSPDWKHHVFSSFSSVDVPISFLSQIWKEIRRKGFDTFSDNEIERYVSIGPHLIKAIRGSRIVIVILSRNYASSLWCLNELVEIINCKEEIGQRVITVFYELAPVDVTEQTGDFGKIFKNTCAGKRKEEIERWRQALRKVATIAGYNSSHRENDAAMIETLATVVSNILNHSTPSIDFERLAGMEAHTENLEPMLCLDSNKEKLHTNDRAFKRISNGLQHYINIYCADTLQYSFASHLTMDFALKGINPFVNRSEALDMIEGASASVVVFSKNYVSSTSCLDILVRVLQCRMKTGQLVVSVFYDTSPLDIVLQEQKSAARIREWSSALQELRELPCYQFRKEYSESELVDMVVKSVYEKLFPTEQIGINLRLQEIERLLAKQPWGIRRIGIWGMPGIGKTTLAEAFFNQIVEGYEASCFIKHFDKAFQEKGLHHLLEKHFGKVLKELPRVCSSITRPSLPGDKLSKKRTLVVLDDVHNPLLAESFLGGFHWFGPGSLIIITSRDKQVFRHCQINHVYEVKRLDENESLQLFSQCTFGEHIKKQNLPELSMVVIEYANGNPLALSFYGRELNGKKLSEMQTTFLKFKLRTPYKIFDLFKSSYESLNDNEKNIFLDIACFFRGENVDYVIQLIQGCGFFPHVGIDVLVEKCLVTISESKVIMHSIIQDFGREIINGETIQIERRRGLWEPWTIKFLLEDDELEVNGNPKATYTRPLGTEDIEGIFMDTSNLIFDVKPGAFENMFNLRFLKIYCSSNEHYGLCLPKGLESLPYELRLLHWEDYPLQSLPQDFDPSQLVELNMPYSKLEKLWEGTKKLGLLKVVRICHSHQLTQIDDICKAQNIEIIDLNGCLKLQSFPPTGQLKYLRVVNLSGCRDIKSFPEVSPNIEKLYLTGCSSLVELHSSIGKVAYLKELYLSGCSSLVELPSSFENATNLQELHLEYCSSLVELPSSIGNITNLKKLCLTGCSRLVVLPYSIGNATNLQELDLSFCSKLVELPSSIGNNTELKKLCLTGCSSLVGLPYSIGNAANLKELYLKTCSNLVELPSSIGNFTNLQELDFSYCSRLVEFPTSIGKITELKKLCLTRCSKFVGLPSSIGNATNLQELDLSYCSRLMELPSSIGNITNLKKLCLTECSNLVELPSSIGNATNLQELDLSYCSKLVELPFSIGNITELKKLCLTRCSKLVGLPSSIGNATNLQELDLSYCSRLVELPSSIGNITNLKKLCLTECSKLVGLPSSIGNAAKLKELYLNRCLSLVELPFSIGYATSLQTLDIENCSNLMELPSSIGNITNLKKLYITGCSSLVGLPYSIGNFINLKELNLEYYRSFVELPSIGNDTKLEDLTGSLVVLPSSFENPTFLEDLSYSISNSANCMSIYNNEDNSLLFLTFSDNSESKCIEVRRATRQNLFVLKGEQKDEHSVYLILHIENNFGGWWKNKNIHFLFYQKRDTAIKVSLEMVEELGITDWMAKYVAELIDILLVNMIPNWKTEVKVDHLILPQLKQNSGSYSNEVKIQGQEEPTFTFDDALGDNLLDQGLPISNEEEKHLHESDEDINIKRLSTRLISKPTRYKPRRQNSRCMIMLRVDPNRKTSQSSSS